VADVIAKAKKDGLTQSELTTKTQWLKKPRRAEIIEDLIESGRVRVTTKEVRGKKVPCYRAR
jgi:hypothetical protein